MMVLLPWLYILAFVAVRVLILFCSGMVQGANLAKTSVWWDWFSARLVPCSGSVAQFQCKRTVESRQQGVRLLVGGTTVSSSCS